MTLAFCLLALLATSSNARADFTMSGPEEAKTSAEILKCAEKDDVQGGLRREPKVSTAEYRSPHRKAFVAWYNPYSGKAACHVYVYVHDDKKGVWVRKVASVFRGTSDVSVEFGDGVTIRDRNGKVIHRDPAE